jgi:acyl-CoA dehydrogenase
VHRVTVSRQLLKGYKPVAVPTEHVPTRREQARRRFAGLLDEATANL